MSLALPFTIVGSATLASRITGFARDVMIAASLGTGPIADIYVAAFLIPNLIRKMVSEGAFNASLVPRLARLERAQHLLAQGLFLDAGNEITHDGQGHVRFQQSQTDFPQHLLSIGFGQTSLPAHGFHHTRHTLGQIFKHRTGFA